jgi:hypothetical protein
MAEFRVTRGQLAKGLRLPVGEKHQIVVDTAVHFSCHTIEGPCFEFDRSFLRPSVADALGPATTELDADPARQALIFGHTDEVGDETYNKGLSERRARATFAFLVHDVKAWEDLYQQEGWGIGSVQDMLQHLGYETGPVRGYYNPTTVTAVKGFQTDHGLAVDGDAGPFTRATLFQAYMESLHPAPFDGSRFPDFMFMGCSEFNPLVDTPDPEEKNRRVVVFVFAPDSKPASLPCQLGSLGPCQASFKPDKNGPRVPGFRCQVYDDLTQQCGCEQPLDIPNDPIHLVTGIPTQQSELVVLDGTTEVTKLPASAATSDGFELKDLDNDTTYRLELRDPDLGLVAAWTLLPGPFRRALGLGDPAKLSAAFQRASDG